MARLDDDDDARHPSKRRRRSGGYYESPPIAAATPTTTAAPEEADETSASGGAHPQVDELGFMLEVRRCKLLTIALGSDMLSKIEPGSVYGAFNLKPCFLTEEADEMSASGGAG